MRAATTGRTDGAFRSAEGRDIVLSIQNEREWADFCRAVLEMPALKHDPSCRNNALRAEHCALADGPVTEVLSGLEASMLEARLNPAQTACSKVHAMEDPMAHPQLTAVPMRVKGERVDVSAVPCGLALNPSVYPPEPALDADGAPLREEFSACAAGPEH